MVLTAAHTTFVIISSDQDYRHYYQLLNSSGYEVIVIHNAVTRPWVQVLEMHAHRAYRWPDLMLGTYVSNLQVEVEDGADLGECVAHTAAIAGADLQVEVEARKVVPKGIEGDGTCVGSDLRSALPGLGDVVGQSSGSNPTTKNKNKSKNRNRNKQTSYTVSQATDADVTVKNGQNNLILTDKTRVMGWAEGTCIRWKGAFGFLSVALKNFSSSSVFGSSSSSGSGPCSGSADPQWAVGMGVGGVGTETGVEESVGLEVQSEVLPEIVEGAHEGVGEGIGVGVGVGASYGTNIPARAPCQVPSSTVLRVYVHYKCLHFDPPLMQLRRGERVRVLVREGDRGPYGARVESLVQVPPHTK